MKLKNKLLIIFIFAIVIFLFVSPKTFATVDKEIIYDDYVYNLDFNGHEAFNGNYDYFIVGFSYPDTNEILLGMYYWNKEYTPNFKFYNNYRPQNADVDYEYSENVHFSAGYIDEFTIFYTYTNRVTIGADDILSFREEPLFNSHYMCSVTYDSDTFFNKALICSSCDLFYYNTQDDNIEDSTLVFQPTWVGQVGFLPIRAIYPTQVIKNMRVTLATIIPIAVVVFSALLSPFLIKYLKSRIL